MDSGRSVVVTGASRGLGLATAAYLHREGWTVVGSCDALAGGGNETPASADRLR